MIAFENFENIASQPMTAPPSKLQSMNPQILHMDSSDKTNLHH